MNQQQQQQQQGQAQPGAAVPQPSQGQNMMRLLKPESLKGLPVLNENEKVKYEEGLRTLWTRMTENPPESPQHQQAKNKIAEFSKMVFNKIQHLQRSQAQAKQAQQQQQQAQQQTTQNSPASTATLQQQQPARPGQSSPGQQGQQGQPAMGNQTLNAGNAVQRPPAQPTRPQGATGAAGAGQQRPAQIPKSIMDHVNAIQWAHLPVPQQHANEAGRWIGNMKNKYLSTLMGMEQARAKIAQCDKAINERGANISPEDLKKITDAKDAAQRLQGEHAKFVSGVRNSITQAQQRAGQAGAAAQTPQKQQGGGATPTTAPTNLPMQAHTASVTAAMQTAKNQQLAAANASQATPNQQQQQPQQQQQQQQQLPQTPVGSTTVTPSTAAQQQKTPVPPPVQPQPQQPPQPPQQQAPQPPQQQAQVKAEPGTQPTNAPPPLNTAMAGTASGPHIVGAVGTPTPAAARVQTPQSATNAPSSAGAGPGAPARPLSHAAAVNRANSSTNVTGQQAQPQQSSGTPNGPGSANASATSSSGHPHAHPQPNSQAMQAKMPIPKNLPDKATAVPSPVTVGGGTGPGRPTYSSGNGIGGGVMGQPVIAKNANGFTFDADSDHVLSKKKLDELVRQVCGGAPSGTDGNYLTPDVEESVLQVTDNFIDTVVNSACRLAKERGSGVLEIRDLQLAVERIYNIRIPGYSSEELRTVRKIAPNSSWIAKMSAVQAAKVMPGARDDK